MNDPFTRAVEKTIQELPAVAGLAYANIAVLRLQVRGEPVTLEAAMRTLEELRPGFDHRRGAESVLAWLFAQ